MKSTFFCATTTEKVNFSSPPFGSFYCRPSEKKLTIAAINIWLFSCIYLEISVLWHIEKKKLFWLPRKAFAEKKREKDQKKTIFERNVISVMCLAVVEPERLKLKRYWKKSKTGEVQEHYLLLVRFNFFDASI